jgi:uncharacterized pyridoxal phosphate-containing UPF0001 family protein
MFKGGKMKTKKFESIVKATQLIETIEKRRELEKLEKELKAFFRSIMKNENVLYLGRYVVLLEDKQRKNLDREKLSKVIDLSDFEKTTEYKTLSIKAS